MSEVKERHRDEHEQVELHDRVAQELDPRVVVAIGHTHDAQWSQDALDQYVDRDQDRGDHAALSEQEPPDEVRESGPPLARGVVAHLANPMRTAAPTTQAANHIANCASTLNRDGTGFA